MSFVRLTACARTWVRRSQPSHCFPPKSYIVFGVSINLPCIVVIFTHIDALANIHTFSPDAPLAFFIEAGLDAGHMSWLEGHSVRVIGNFRFSVVSYVYSHS